MSLSKADISIKLSGHISNSFMESCTKNKRHRSLSFYNANMLNMLISVIQVDFILDTSGITQDITRQITRVSNIHLSGALSLSLHRFLWY